MGVINGRDMRTHIVMIKRIGEEGWRKKRDPTGRVLKIMLISN